MGKRKKPLKENPALTPEVKRHNAIYDSPEFHTARHTAFTPEENLALDSFVAPTVMIKTKGRK